MEKKEICKKCGQEEFSILIEKKKDANAYYYACNNCEYRMRLIPKKIAKYYILRYNSLDRPKHLYKNLVTLIDYMFCENALNDDIDLYSSLELIESLKLYKNLIGENECKEILDKLKQVQKA